jgi:hypothetical protein
MRLGLWGEIRMLKESLALYRTHGEATSFRAATAETSREYLRVLDTYFARNDLPPSLQARKAEAYGRACLLLARNALWRGDIRMAFGSFKDAVGHDPALDTLGERLRLLRQGVSKPLKELYWRAAGGTKKAGRRI